MKIVDIEQNTDEWLEFRKSKISGSKLKDLVIKRGTAKKIGYYQLLADRLEEDTDYEEPRERGHRLENEGLEAFEKLKDLEVNKDCGIWQSDIDPNIIVSPDGGIAIEGEYVAAVEVKCLNGARHLQAVIENKIPSEYYEQCVQYFIVNEKLETLYFTFYHPNIPSRKLHVIEMHRSGMEDYIEELRQYEIDQLREIESLVEQLAF